MTETKAAPAAGNIGLFVDIGNESFFSNLEVTPKLSFGSKVNREEFSLLFSLRARKFRFTHHAGLAPRCIAKPGVAICGKYESSHSFD